MTEANTASKLIDLETIETDEIQKILNQYFIDSELDEDNDLIIDASVRIYVRPDKEAKILRLFSFLRTKENSTETELLTKLESINRVSYTVKYSNIKTTVMAEYGIPLHGHIDHKHLIKTIYHVDGEIKLLKIRASDYIEG